MNSDNRNCQVFVYLLFMYRINTILNTHQDATERKKLWSEEYVDLPVFWKLINGSLL